MVFADKIIDKKDLLRYNDNKRTGGGTMNFMSIAKRSEPLLSCPMHKHPCWELIYQLDAPTTAVTALGSFDVKPGELIVIPPNTPHRTVSDTPFRDFCIKLDRLDFPHTPTVVRDTDGTILGIYELLNGLCHEHDEAGTALIETLGEALVLAVKKATAALREPTAIVRFKNLLHENVGNPYFDLTEGIRALGYHPDYFRRSFKRYTSLSPLRYLNGLRIERAKDLLRLETSLSVGEIAARCGFSDPLYFSTAFKAQVGISPLNYRKGEK